MQITPIALAAADGSVCSKLFPSIVDYMTILILIIPELAAELSIKETLKPNTLRIPPSRSNQAAPQVLGLSNSTVEWCVH